MYARSLAWFTRQGLRGLHLYSGSGGVSDFDAAFGIQALDGAQTATAEQGARANVHIGHASCYRFLFRIEASDRVAESGTSHARCGRGSSLTFGKVERARSRALSLDLLC